MFNKYAQYPKTSGIVIVRNRDYKILELRSTDNIKARIQYCEENLYADKWVSFEYIPMANSKEIAQQMSDNLL
jgi:hypothetical protein